MNEANDNAIKGTPLEDLVRQAREAAAESSQHGTFKSHVNDTKLQQRVDELEEELASVKQDLQDVQDRLSHVEPVFGLAKELSYHVNPYLQGEKQAQIAEWFRRNGYQNYFEERGL